MLNASPPVFLSKIICIATSHSSGVMFNSNFPVMDEAIQVRAMTEFVHQVYVKLIGAHKHSYALKPLSILNMGPITSFLPTSLSTFLRWKVKKKHSKNWMKLWRKFFSLICHIFFHIFPYLLMRSVKWQCKQINKNKTFFCDKFFFVGMLVCATGIICFTFILWRLTSYFLILKFFTCPY